MKKTKAETITLEETELRNLKVNAAHPFRGTLSPSKNSYIPSLIEQTHPPLKSDKTKLVTKQVQTKSLTLNEETKNVLACFDAKHLPALQQDFEAAGGFLDLSHFVECMLSRLAHEGESARDIDHRTSDTAALIALFTSADLHSTGALTWEIFSCYLVEQGLSRKEASTDAIKTIGASRARDVSKHVGVVDKLLYVEDMDALVCVNRNSRSFRVYDPVSLRLRHEVFGHRGSVITSTYCSALGQLVTTGADLQLCFWDSVKLEMRNRLSCKDIQLCVASGTSGETAQPGLYSV